MRFKWAQVDRDPKALHPDDLERIRRVAAEEPPEGTAVFWPARDTAIIELLAGAGLRASELCGLNIDSVAVVEAGPRVLVSGAKGGKTRRIPIQDASVYSPTPTVVSPLVTITTLAWPWSANTNPSAEYRHAANICITQIITAREVTDE